MGLRALLGGCAIGSAGCPGGGGSDPAPIGMSATDVTTTTDPTGLTTTTSESSTSGADTSTGPAPNCDDVLCAGHGTCEIGEDGQPFCACDPGYVLDATGDTCLVDESCVQLRFLEDHCRQAVAGGPPAVSLFFALDFCAGTAVLPDKVEELGLQFQVLENGVDIQRNVESYSTVIPKPVESYVDLVLDVSDSVTEAEDLPMLIAELRNLVASLAPATDEPDVYVAIHVFGRDSAEYVAFTRDLASVDAALAAIAEDPTPVVTLAGNGNGTDLYDAVELGIDRTQRIRDLRDAVTWGGVLSTGTVVVVTDGNDTSNGILDRGLIDNTTNNVISIGISAEVDNEALQTIGRDGSFLAPTPADWTAAFAEITQRVDEYPLRSYLLAYCSSATEGEPEVEVSITGAAVKVATTAICQFNADLFGTDPADVCDAALFDAECTVYECGGLTACGACSDDQCCTGSTCIAPHGADDGGTNVDCENQDALCEAAGQVCDAEGISCVNPEPVGTGTCGAGCQPGVAYCSETTMECVPVFGMGEPCEEPGECPQLNCQPVNPDNPLDQPVCLPRALMYDECGSDDAVCEAGAYCNSECLPQKRFAESCGGPEECRHATCEQIEGAGNRCLAEPVCFWSWDQKAPT